MKDGEKSFDKLLRTLEGVSNSPSGATAKELMECLGMPRSTAFRILKFLEKQGYLRKNGERYCLGHGLLRLGVIAEQQNSLLKIAHPYLSELAQLTKETIHLAELKGTEVVYIDKVEGSRSIRMCSMIGNVNPAYCTGIGKAILAFLPQEELERKLDEIEFHKFTATTITSRSGLLKELKNIRANKVAYDNGEHESGVFCLSAPVFDFKGKVIAAISVAGAEIYIRKNSAEYAGMVKNTAVTISCAIGAKL